MEDELVSYDKDLGEVIKLKKQKKKKRQEKLIQSLEKKRRIEDFNNPETANSVRFDNVFEAQNAEGRQGRDYTVSLEELLENTGPHLHPKKIQVKKKPSENRG